MTWWQRLSWLLLLMVGLALPATAQMTVVIEGTPTGPATVPDGDKGDVTVSSSGAVWTIDNTVVTYAKMQNVSATARLLGRNTAGAGPIEELSATTAKTLLGLNNVDNTSDATKWTATKKLENTRLKPRVLAQADVSPITIDKDSFDIVKIAELSQATTFNPPTTTTTHDVGDLLLIEIFTTTQRALTFSTAANGFIADANLALPTLSDAGGIVKYLFEWNGAKWALLSSTQTTARGGLDECYKSNGSLAEPGFRACLENASVTYAKLQNTSAASRLLGRGSAAGAGTPQEILLGTGLTMSDTTLNATGGGGIAGTIGEVLLPVTSVNQPSTNMAVIDRDSTGVTPVLKFDGVTKECAYWGPFRMKPDYTSTPVFKWQYSMTSATGAVGVSIGVSVVAVVPGSTDNVHTKAYATANFCDDATVPSAVGRMKEISCPLVNNDSLVAGALTKIQICREVARTADSASTSDMEGITASLEYTR